MSLKASASGPVLGVGVTPEHGLRDSRISKPSKDCVQKSRRIIVCSASHESVLLNGHCKCCVCVCGRYIRRNDPLLEVENIVYSNTRCRLFLLFASTFWS